MALTVALGAAGLAGGLAGGGPRHGPAVVAVPFLVALTAAGALQLEYRYRDHVDARDLFEAVLAPALLAFPGLGVVAVAAAAKALSQGLRRVHPVKACFNVAQWAAAAGAGSVVFAALRPSGPASAADLFPLAAAMVAVLGVSNAAVVAVLRLVERRPLRRVLADLTPIIVLGWVIGGAVNLTGGVLLAAAYGLAPGLVVLFPVPLAALHWASRGYAAGRADRARLAGLQRATHALAQPVDPRQAIGPFLAEVRACFESEAVDLVVATDGRREVHRLAGAGPAARADADAALAAALLDADEAVRVTTASPGPGLAELLRREGWRDCIGAPVRAGGRVVGALCAYNRSGLTGSEEGEPAVLDALANEVGNALQKADLLEAILAEDRELRRAQRALADSEARFRALVQNSSDVVTVLDAGGTVRYVSPAFSRVLGHDERSYVGHRGSELVHPDDAGAVLELLAKCSATPGVGGPFEYRVRAADGSWRWFETLANNRLDDPAVRGVVLNSRDVTDRKRSEELLSGQATVLESIAQDAPLTETLGALAAVVEAQSPGARCAVLLLDEAGTALRVGAATDGAEAALEVDGLAVGPAAGWCGTAVARREPVVVADLAADPAWAERREAALAGRLRAAWVMPVLASDGGRVLGCVAVHLDEPRRPEPADWRLLEAAARLAHVATERVQARTRLAYQATHDPLTGLANRVVFLDRAALALARTVRTRSSVAVLFVDLDRFKVINDSLGHEAGDRLLIALAERLSGIVRPADTLARFGGDEFTILCEDISTRADAVAVAERVREALEPPFLLDGVELFVTASIGIALSDDPRTQPDALVENADAAMYRAKDRGGKHFEVYDHTMRARALRRLATQNALYRALERDEFRVFYQPTVSLRTGRVVGVEALVRWESPKRGLVPPVEFIDLAEETGLIVPLGTHVLEEACRQAGRWRRAGPGGEPLTMSVNLSARQFAHPDLVGVVASALETTGTDPATVALEITESVLMEDAESTAAALRGLKDLGVVLLIDDFGTGYSSLSYLKRFPVDGLKVDRSFVGGLGSDPEDSAIVAAVVGLAHSLGLVAVAEGVETTEHLVRLQELGCDVAQGYHLGRPLPAEALDLGGR